MKYSIGLDIGITSIGWAVINNKYERIEDLGVRTFTVNEHPKDGSSLAGPRRDARGLRRRLRRRRHRLERIVNTLLIAGILTDKEEIYSDKNIDTWGLRVKALDERITNIELAKVISALAKRRGFKSNRKSEIKENETGKMKESINKNELLMKEKKYRTVGEMVYKDEKFSKTKRNSDGNYLFTVTREMLQNELELILETQMDLGNSKLTTETNKKIIDIFASQRHYATDDMIEKMIGFCTFEKDEKRGAKATYTSEKFVLLQLLNNFKLIDKGKKRFLTKEEKEKLQLLSYNKVSVKYSQIRKELSLSENIIFDNINYEDEKSEDKKFCELKSYHEIRKNIQSNISKEKWESIKNDINLLDNLGIILTYYKDDITITEKFRALNIDENIIESVLDLSFSKVGNLSLKAMKKINPYLEQGMTYDKACVKAGYNFKDEYKGQKYELLPRIIEDMEVELKNPVVLRAVTETRKVLNAIIRKYGKPETINIELAREISKNHKDRNKIKKIQEENLKNTEKAFEDFKEQHERNPKKDEILKYKLYKEQHGKSGYTFKPIDISRISEDGYVQIDHIIPYSRCYNNSYMNKVLVLSSENQNKGNRTPYEWFGDDESKWHKYEETILSNKTIPYVKKKNLLMKDFKSEGFKERNLVDTRYISRFIKNYIEKYLDFEDGRVKTINGALTSFLRHQWGLSKIREEGDKHHALDAAVVAVSTDSMVKKIGIISKKKELYNVKKEYIDYETGELIELSKYKISPGNIRYPKPWDHFTEELEHRLNENIKEMLENTEYQKIFRYSYDFIKTIKPVFVSRKINKKITGAAHKDTLYSMKHIDKNIVTKKKKIIEISQKELEESYSYGLIDKASYEVLIERLNTEPNAKKAFLNPVYKPSKSENKNEIKSIKIVETSTSGVSINNGEALAHNSSMIRVDVFTKDKKYYLVPIYVVDLVKKELPNKAIVSGKNKIWIEMTEEYEFLFSLHQYDLIRVVQKKSKKNPEGGDLLGYYTSTHSANASINFTSHDRSLKFEGQGVKTLLKFEKYQVDMLGNYHKVKKERRLGLEKSNNNKKSKTKS